MIVVGLTGSIGMGKSTTARLFAEEGAPVWDADATVHRLYAAGGAAVAAVEAAFAGVTDPHGAIDRVKLGARVHGNAEAFSRLEGIVHPLVAADRGEFLDRARASRAPVAILDIPLLFETGAAERMDAVVVVSAPAHVQRQRVLARPGMDEARLAALLERQTPDHHKRAGADFVIDTSEGVEPARVQVRQVLAALADPGFRSRRGGLDEAPEAQH